MKIYISIPITGRPMEEVRKEADAIARKIKEAGHTPVNPLDVYCGKDPQYADYICHTLRAMLDCDAIYSAKGWEKSCGCRIEKSTAALFTNHGHRTFLQYSEGDKIFPDDVPPQTGNPLSR